MAGHVGVRAGDVRLELPATAGEQESRSGGPVYRWDPLFSRSDAVLKSVRAGQLQLQLHCEQQLAHWHEAAGEQALERAHDVEREARGDTAPGTAAARAERSRKLSHSQVERMLPGLLPRLLRGLSVARVQGALQARGEPRLPHISVWPGPLVGVGALEPGARYNVASCLAARRVPPRARCSPLRRARCVALCAASVPVPPMSQSWMTPSRC